MEMFEAKFVTRGCCLLLAFAFLLETGEGQLASVFDKGQRSSACRSWSGWGDCIWTTTSRQRGRTSSSSNLYLKQLSKRCQRHWFYKYVDKNYGVALNNFFLYLRKVTMNKKPCGMCSYRQSCGIGGPKQCHKAPWQSKRKKMTPFFVAEQVCTKRELGGHRQNGACKVRYNLLRRNSRLGRYNECRLWPSRIPKLTNVPNVFKSILYKLKWSICIPSKQRRRGRPAMCRCCCFPFRPNPKTFKCEHIPGAPPPPGF